jgi:hypothetical protein
VLTRELVGSLVPREHRLHRVAVFARRREIPDLRERT